MLSKNTTNITGLDISSTVESKLKPGLDGFGGGTGISEAPCAKSPVRTSDLYIRLWPLLSALA